jgi:hypothetical protein
MNIKYKEGTKADTVIETAGTEDSGLTQKEILEWFRGRKFGIIVCRSCWWW